MNPLRSMTLHKFIFGLQATSLIWINWIPNDIVVRQSYQDKAINVSHNIQAATAADDDIILAAELAVTARNEAVADERLQTSPLGLIFVLMLKPKTKPVEHFRNKYARGLFGKTYNECLHGEQLKVILQHKRPYEYAFINRYRFATWSSARPGNQTGR